MGFLSKLLPDGLKKDKGRDREETDTQERGRGRERERGRSTAKPEPKGVGAYFAQVDPILGHKTSKPHAAPTPKVIRRGSKRLARSRSRCRGSEMACMSSTSFVGYSGSTINYQYEFKLKYGTLKGDPYQN